MVTLWETVSYRSALRPTTGNPKKNRNEILRKPKKHHLMMDGWCIFTIFYHVPPNKLILKNYIPRLGGFDFMSTIQIFALVRFEKKEECEILGEI